MSVLRNIRFRLASWIVGDNTFCKNIDLDLLEQKKNHGYFENCTIPLSGVLVGTERHIWDSSLDEFKIKRTRRNK